MVEVFEQGEIERHLDIRVLFAAGKIGGEFDRKLFVSYRGFENCFVRGLQRAYLFLLLLLHAPYQGDFAAQVVVAAVSGKLVRKPIRLEFRSVHKYDAEFGVRVCGVFVVGLDQQVLPALEGVAHGSDFLFEWVERHKLSFCGKTAVIECGRAAGHSF